MLIFGIGPFENGHCRCGTGHRHRPDFDADHLFVRVQYYGNQRAGAPRLHDAEPQNGCKPVCHRHPGHSQFGAPSLLVSFLNSILAAYSQVYVVVLGIYYKLQTFLYLPANGIVQGMRPIIGYNYGAGEDARVKRIYNLTLAMTGTIMAGGTVLCLVFAGPLMNVFSSNPETIAAGQTALRIICAGFIVSSLTVTGSGALEGLGKRHRVAHHLAGALHHRHDAHCLGAVPSAWPHGRLACVLDHRSYHGRHLRPRLPQGRQTAVISLYKTNKATLLHLV